MDDGGANATTVADGGAEAAPKAKDAGSSFLADAQLAGKTCERSIDVGALTISNETCYVNEHVSNRSGTLSFPCEGGKASVNFNGKKFSGTIKGDAVFLELVEPFVFNSCQWESTETIDGDLASGTLSYAYKERPLAACTDTPCTGNGTLTAEGGEIVVVK